MPDLSPEEREALNRVGAAWLYGEAQDDDADEVVDLVRRALAAVPRLAQPEAEREVRGFVIVWNGVPQDGSFFQSEDAFERDDDGTINTVTFAGWPADSEVVPARLLLSPAPPPTDREGAKDG